MDKKFTNKSVKTSHPNYLGTVIYQSAIAGYTFVAFQVSILSFSERKKKKKKKFKYLLVKNVLKLLLAFVSHIIRNSTGMYLQQQQ